ncbi:FAD-dependent oxidoreductase [Synechococcus sp. RSCCF101]|uniref:FAD-dependent oxidoreductase n=1 Tax=Synechococcus sp. RSCCF101 TaxID=2511069 RepID=UPI00177E9DBA|nr:FAD-dependent oxidoreductase [Synechococcus sp. RSCCF101]
MAPEVIVVGAGVVGSAVAWQLSRQGCAVTLMDPELAETTGPTQAPPAPSAWGSPAALGVLMGQVYRRRSGRGLRLRQEAMALWPRWIAELRQAGHRLPARSGLLLLAADADEEGRLRAFADAHGAERDLRWLEPGDLRLLEPHPPRQALGGLHSATDGQIDPLPLLQALRSEVARLGGRLLPDRVRALERCQRGWRVQRQQGEPLEGRWLVLCVATGLNALLAPLNHPIPVAPVLGQALELELTDPLPDGDLWRRWPGAMVWRGLNLVPRPGRRLWVGATVEPGRRAGSTPLNRLRELEGDPPDWLRRSRLCHRWEGIRPRPAGRPAPVLEQPEPGLIVATAHHRNGVLLAPASAAWVSRQIGLLTHP